jgi:hypothetical protein
MPSKYMYQDSNRMKRAHKTHKSISILKLANKKLSCSHSLSPSFSLYSHQKYIKKTKKELPPSVLLLLFTYTHNFNVSVLRTWCPPTSMRKNSMETKRNKRANNSIEGIRKWNITTHTYICIYTKGKKKVQESKTSHSLVNKNSLSL